MTRLSRLPPRDLDALSAYADGRLSPVERQRMEARLRDDPALRRSLDEIRATSGLLRAMPSVRPPRNFVLTPEMASVRRRWLGYPVLQLATAMATLAFFVTVGLDVFAPAAAPAAFRAAAPSEEMALEAPAAMDALPQESGAAVLGVGAVSAVAETAMPAVTATEMSVTDAMQASAPTGPPLLQPGEYASREVPNVGGEGGPPPALTEAGTPAPNPLAAGGPAATPTCEACSGEVEIPPPSAPVDKVAHATATPEAVPVTQEAMLQTAQGAPTDLATETRQPSRLPPVRWLEVGLAAAALIFGASSQWARRKTG
jgi:anti-sigma factor RsiW